MESGPIGPFTDNNIENCELNVVHRVQNFDHTYMDW